MIHHTSTADQIQLRLEGISHSYAERRVLTDISFTAAAGERIGILGENGSGKSTLLAIAAGRLSPDAGMVRATAAGGHQPRIGLLQQYLPFDPHLNVRDAMDLAAASVAAEAELDASAAALALHPEDTKSVHRYAAALEKAEALDVWNAPVRLEQILTGLSISHLERDRPVHEFSGGEQARIGLAWMLMNSPEILLLDEPTNHLDDAGIDFLGVALARHHGPVLLASHDRAFLEASINVLIDLDPAPTAHQSTRELIQDGTGTGIGVRRFSGTFTEYLHSRHHDLVTWKAQYEREQQQIVRLRREVKDSQQVGHPDWKPRSESRISAKFYADRNATVVSRRVNDSARRLAQAEDAQIRKPPSRLRFAGLHSSLRQPATGGTHLSLSALGVAVAGRLDPVTVTLSGQDRLLVTGANGSGKSTLLAVLAGILEPTTGTVTIPRSLKIATFTQHVPFAAAEMASLTAEELYQRRLGAERAQERPLKSLGLLAGRDLGRRIETLSGGTRRRLALALVIADPPSLLLLDEPTNHLSLWLATELEESIPDYPGMIVVASHDRWLRERWEGRRLHLGSG